MGMFDINDLEPGYNPDQKNVFDFKVGKQECVVETLECEVCRARCYNIRFEDDEYQRKIAKLKGEERKLVIDKLKKSLPQNLNKNMVAVFNVQKCPSCGASRARLGAVLSAKERRERLKKKLAKEKAKEKGRYSRAEEIKLVDTLCENIYSEFLDTLKILKDQLFKGKISVHHFYYLLDRKVKKSVLVNRRLFYKTSKDFKTDFPSKYFVKFIRREAIDFGTDVEEIYANYLYDLDELKQESEENDYRVGYQRSLKKKIKKASKKEVRYEIRHLVKKGRRFKNKQIRFETQRVKK